MPKREASRASTMVSIWFVPTKTHVEALSPVELLRGGESLEGPLCIDRLMFSCRSGFAMR